MLARHRFWVAVARERCWIHEDCLVDLELSIACGPNPPDMQVLDGDWGVDDWAVGDGYGDGCNGHDEGDGDGHGHGYNVWVGGRGGGGGGGSGSDGFGGGGGSSGSDGYGGGHVEGGQR